MVSFSIVTLVQQDPQILDLFLNSLRATLSCPSQVIVVEDGTQPSVRPILDRLSQQMPAGSTVEIFRNPEARGYAASANQALARTTGEIVVMADSDVIFMDGWQGAFERAFRDNAQAGAIGAKLLYPQTGGIQHCGLAFSRDAIRHLWLNAPAAAVSGPAYPVQAVAFALCAIRRTTLEACGALDEEYFNGYEDLDYCARIRAAGFQVLVDPQICGYHWERSSGVHREFNRRRNLGRFWRLWGQSLEADLWGHIEAPLRRELANPFPGAASGVVLVDLCEDRSDVKSLADAVATVVGRFDYVRDCHARIEANSDLWLPRLLGRDGHEEPCRYIFAVHNFIKLSPNHYWWNLREKIRDDDLVVDMYANVQGMKGLMASAWPGHKIR